MTDKLDAEAVYCTKCEQHVAARSHGAFEDWEDQFDGTRYALLECPSCSAPFLFRRYGPSVDRAGNTSAEEWDHPAQLYPPVEDPLGRYVPDDISAAYHEARRVFIVKSYDSAALMCRKCIELVCKVHNAAGSNLRDKLKWMLDQAFIEQRIYQWADEVLREIGNDAAHANQISKDDARDAIEFTKAILDYLFVFLPAFKAFKARHSPP